MDSGSFWRIFAEIILPMSGNIMIVVLILMITSVWNDFLVGLTFGGIGAQPMTVILANSVITYARRGHLQRRHGRGAADRDPAAGRLFRARPVLRPGHHRRRDQGVAVPNVEFRNIVKQFGRVTVLEDLDLTVDDGEFLVLLGPSGCGKTTLLNLLAGLHEVTAGTITIGGRDVTDLDPKDRGLAMVFQSYALYPTKTVRGNLKFGLSAQRLDRAEIERRVAWAAQAPAASSRCSTASPAQLSGGQRQRVAIGRALVKNVDVFLFDEPLSNLDAKLRTEMRSRSRSCTTSSSKTIVYVTHDQIEAMTMATRIAVMDGGVIQQIGTPDEIYERPANLFVARLHRLAADEYSRDDDRSRRQPHRRRSIGRPASRCDLVRLRLHQAAGRRMKVMVGLRPEHFAIGKPNGSKPAAIFDLPLRYSEKTGSDGTAFLAAADDELAGGACRPFADRRAPGRGERQGDLSGRPVQRVRCRNPASNLASRSNREETMSKRLLTALGAGAGDRRSALRGAAATELTLFHTWSNESEMAALNAIIKAFEAKGNTITDRLGPARDRPARARWSACSSPARRPTSSSPPSRLFRDLDQARLRRDARRRSSTRSAPPRPSPRRC